MLLKTKRHISGHCFRMCYFWNQLCCHHSSLLKLKIYDEFIVYYLPHQGVTLRAFTTLLISYTLHILYMLDTTAPLTVADSGRLWLLPKKSMNDILERDESQQILHTKKVKVPMYHGYQPVTSVYSGLRKASMFCVAVVCIVNAILSTKCLLPLKSADAPGHTHINTFNLSFSCNAQLGP